LPAMTSKEPVGSCVVEIMIVDELCDE